jgi:hypothetical protein
MVYYDPEKAVTATGRGLSRSCEGTPRDGNCSEPTCSRQLQRQTLLSDDPIKTVPVSNTNVRRLTQGSPREQHSPELTVPLFENGFY